MIETAIMNAAAAIFLCFGTVFIAMPATAAGNEPHDQADLWMAFVFGALSVICLGLSAALFYFAS